MTRLEPADIVDLAEALRCCGVEKRTVELGGHFTKRAMGGAIAPAAATISIARLNAVAQYEPADLTISVEAGLGVQQLEDLLAANNQMLPLDPPFPETATVGGVIAANCCGPRRRQYGAARDMVIGMSFLTLEGKEVRSGGMVVKNVAGLDMAKLLIGSFGTLAAMARVNFKLFPKPPREMTFVLSYQTPAAAWQARDLVIRGELQPAAIDLANPAAAERLAVALPAGYVLLLQTGGIDAVMARYERDLQAIARETAASEFAVCEPEQARRLWRGVRNFPALRDEDGAGAAVLRVSTVLNRLHECFELAGSRPALARAGSGVAYLYCRPFDPELLARARSAGLYTVVESCSSPDKSGMELWADPGPELATMREIKQALDPHLLLNHGRLYNRL